MLTTNQSAVTPSVTSGSRPTPGRQLKVLALLTLLLIACLSRPLYSLLRFTIHSNLYSHILLIPFVSAYLVWLGRRNLSNTSVSGRLLGLVFYLMGFGFLFAYWWPALAGAKIAGADYLALMTSSFLCFFAGTILLLFGLANVRCLSFPLAFLIFMIPFPTFLEHAIEAFLQRGSATAACGLFKLAGMPVYKQGMELHLPGFAMQVAPECSGIHSSLVLFMTSLVAANVLLRVNWTRTIFVFAVIPLAMLRNGFRIFVLGELCVQVDPAWIHSDLHERGGPLFFALSLIPFFLLLLLLRKFESRNRRGLSLTPRFSEVAGQAGVNLTVSTVAPAETRSFKRP